MDDPKKGGNKVATDHRGIRRAIPEKRLMAGTIRPQRNKPEEITNNYAHVPEGKSDDDCD